MVGRVSLLLCVCAGVGLGGAAIAACSSGDGSNDAEARPSGTADDPACAVDDAPPLGECSAADVVFSAASAEAGARDGASDASIDPDAADGGADAGADAETGDAGDAEVDAGASALAEAGAPPLGACTVATARAIACRSAKSITAAAGNDGSAFVVAVGSTRAELVALGGSKPSVEKLPETFESGDTATVLATLEGEPFIVSSRKGAVYTQIGTAPAELIPGTKTQSFGARAWNAGGALAVTVNGAPAPQGLVRRPDGSISVENAPTNVPQNFRYVGITDDGKLFSAGLDEDSRGGVSLGEGLSFGFRSARLRFSPSTPAGTPPVVALESSSLDIGVWDPSTNEYGFARVVRGVALCARNDECSNTCGESGTEASPNAFAVARDRDGTIVVAYLRRELTRQRRYRRATGGLCSHIDCACGSEMENEHITRAEIVILQVDPDAREVRERFVLALPAKDNRLGYDVGFSSVPHLDAQLRDGHLLLTFTGVGTNDRPGMSLYDIRVR